MRILTEQQIQQTTIQLSNISSLWHQHNEIVDKLLTMDPSTPEFIILKQRAAELFEEAHKQLQNETI